MSTIGHHDEYVLDVYARLTDVAAEAANLSLVGLSAETLNTVTTESVGFVSQAQGLEFAAIQEAEASAMSVQFGNRVLTTHLAKTTHQPTRALGADRAMAIWLRDFSTLHDGLSDATLSRSHLAELKDIDRPRIRHLLVRDQQLFVDAARDFAWTEWQQVVAYWLNAADPDGELTDPADPKYGMRVRTRANGDVIVTIRLDPVTGEAFLTMHDAEVKKLERNERQALNDNPNAETTSASQKNLDALLRLMVRGWRREDGSYPDFLINIVMSEHVAEDLLARSFGHTAPDGDNPLDIDPFELPISWDDIDRRSETIRGTPIHPKHALGLLLAAKLRRQVFDAETINIDHSEDFRFFTKKQKNALLVMQRGQCNLGTQAPFRWLEADHIQPNSKNGKTIVTNGQMINRADNHAKGDTE